MTFVPGDAQWISLRDDLVPFIGERAFSFFALAVAEQAGRTEVANQVRHLLVTAGNDIETPQLTETERLLVEWGRQLAGDSNSVDTGDPSRIDRAFSPQLRRLLSDFASALVSG